MRVVVINKAMTKYWDDTDPIGTRISPNGGPNAPRVWYTVVGIVGDVRQFGLAQESVAQLYLPLTQSPFGIAGQILVRTAGDPAAFGNVLRTTVYAVDPNQPVENVRTLESILRSAGLGARRLKIVVEEGARHTEGAWAGRLPEALALLFGRPVNGRA